MHRQRYWTLTLVSGLVAACATGKGTKPADMSQAGHESAAEREEQLADEHEADAERARAASSAPPPPPGSVVQLGQEGCVPAQTVCWTSVANPTAEHKQEAERHRDLAARHRAASQALVAAEQRACSGLSEAERDMSPFRHTEDIASVSEAQRTEAHGRVNQTHAAGATIVFRAVPGMTEQWLQRLVDCHVARAAVLGSDASYMPYCPLMVKGAKAAVRPVSDGFAVDVRADNAQAAREILTRAQRLRAPGS